MEDDDACNTSLSLGLGMGGHVPPRKGKQKLPSLDLTFDDLCPKGEQTSHVNQQLHDHKAKGLLSLKHPNENNSPDSSNNSNTGIRKKLKLTKEQSDTLEDIFKMHTTLNPAQKQALAEKLNLKHRQVEVWFQNRRARTKLKQTEVDCEFLKKCCEKLTHENLKLKKELQELRAQQMGQKPLYIQLSKAATTLNVCSLCEKEWKPNEEKKESISDMIRNSSQKLQNSVGIKGI